MLKYDQEQQKFLDRQDAEFVCSMWKDKMPFLFFDLMNTLAFATLSDLRGLKRKAYLQLC